MIQRIFFPLSFTKDKGLQPTYLARNNFGIKQQNTYSEYLKFFLSPDDFFSNPFFLLISFSYFLIHSLFFKSLLTSYLLSGFYSRKSGKSAGKAFADACSGEMFFSGLKKYLSNPCPFMCA
ncbi:predicted protein [Methanosarcina acetivorans C2A]|uniref:Uncharacterized protein n=1 Tax=Methanosarcina acetivorans (strain ATCC 35395 / DSM 2834 / JCM 12185 / C2A) TaxID=188937 RepID=Q8TIT5_METAC|nr:predicted protein [Methanosarcina acetivorans C2A]